MSNTTTSNAVCRRPLRAAQEAFAMVQFLGRQHGCIAARVIGNGVTKQLRRAGSV